jgi:hypothetical protein
VPKSVSLLYALTEDQKVIEAFRESVHETMAEVEAEMKVRVRKNGRNQERVTGNIAYGEFIHFTSRPVDGVPDPQLHAHCFVFNATHDAEEGAWKAGQFRDLKRDAPYWQGAFRVRLPAELKGRLKAKGWPTHQLNPEFSPQRFYDWIETLFTDYRTANPERPVITSHLFRKTAFTRAWAAGIDPRQASIAIGCNIDTMMKHYVQMDEQQVTDEVFEQLNGK